MMFHRKHSRQQRRYFNTQIFRNKILDIVHNISTVNFMIFVFMLFFISGFCGMSFWGRKYVEGFWYLKEENILVFLKERWGSLFHYIWRERSCLYLGLVCVGVMRNARWISWGVIVVFGILFGIFASELFLAFGNSGLFLGMLMVFPYMICYILGSGMILRGHICDNNPESREKSGMKKISRYIFVYLLFFLGMVVECYYFPWILRTVYVAFLG